MATVTGTTSNDTLTGTVDPLTGGPADDAVDGKAGIDTFVLAGAASSYSFGFDLTSGAVVVSGAEGSDTLAGVELLLGPDGTAVPVGALLRIAEPVFAGTPSAATTAGADYLLGTDLADYLNGGAGNDSIAGGGGNDWLFGGAGNDRILGQTGDDHLEGYDGNDVLFGGTGDDALNGDLIGQTGNDYLSGGEGNDWITGGNGADFLDGGAGRNFLLGQYGPDTLLGGSGEDLLYGDFQSSRYFQPVVNPKDPPNDDVLMGGAGNDYLLGGMGADVLMGGAGADRFVFTGSGESTPAAPDLILDFGGAAVARAAAAGGASSATIGNEYDVIDLTEIDAIAGTAWNDEFTFIDTAAFTAPGQLRYEQAGAMTYIEGNMDGNLAVDFRIAVKLPVYFFSPVDFML